MNKQLRATIGIAAPARREAADGSEEALRVVLGFEPRWYHVRCGVDFGPRWHDDPSYRRETLVAMRAELQRAFPTAHQWRGDEARDVNTIAGCHGVGVMPAAFGMKLRYYADRWPHPEPGQELDDARVDALDPEAILSSDFVAGVMGQIDEMSARWGAVYGDLNWQGVLNTAFQLRGERVFEDMVERPELAARLFEVIAQATIRLAQLVQARQRASGFAIDWMGVSNCTLSMISPAMYRRQLQRFDAAIAEAFERFGVHTCNWDATRYLDALCELPRVGYLDMGLETNLGRARELFPEARRAVLCDPRLLQGRGAADEVLGRIRRELSPCDVVVADIGWDMPDEVVNGILEAAGRAVKEMDGR